MHRVPKERPIGASRRDGRALEKPCVILHGTWLAESCVMNTTWRKAFICTCLLAAAVGFSACSDATDPVVTKIDCSSVCNRYKECYDDDFNTGKCKDDCENLAEDNDAKQDQLDDCDDCLDDESCTSSTYSCAAACGKFILP
jgi:hypothetical protein